MTEAKLFGSRRMGRYRNSHNETYIYCMHAYIVVVVVVVVWTCEHSLKYNNPMTMATRVTTNFMKLSPS
jgi:hypothetical protein